MSELEFRVEIDLGVGDKKDVVDVYKVYGRSTYDTNLPFTKGDYRVADIVKPLEFESAYEGDFGSPFMELSHGDASSLMDQLYACGIRPTNEEISDEVNDEVGFLKEILRRQDIHLGDLRSILELRNEDSLKAAKAKFDHGDRIF